ncbi:MAG: hypothetical protein IT330_14130 [Anaerolineae bacterium]|nr:hypothetical protein [Anaerolineae bacterium]
MNDRARFVATILGDPVDRPPYWLYWSPWASTVARWEKEGKPKEVTNHRSLFGHEQPPLVVPVNCGPCPKLERTIIEEHDEYFIYLDEWGIKRRDTRDAVTIPEFLEFPVKGWEDWRRFKEERLNPDDPARLGGNWRELCLEWAQKGYPIQLGYYPDVTLYGCVRWLLGDEECLLAFLTMPDLVHDIMDHLTSLYLTVFAKVVKEVQVDVIHIWEDMCYRAGPLISPRHWEEFMGPNYRRIHAFAREHNIPIISVDTDGDPDRITPAMMGSGVNFLFPMEVAAGCDVNLWQARYPTLGMMGGIDKRALARGPQAIDRELARIRPAVEKGRYIPALDHTIPDDISWENYCYYAQALKRLVYG